MRRPGGTPLPPPPGGALPPQPLPPSPTSAAAEPPRPNSAGFGLSVGAGVGGGDADIEPLVANIRSLTPGTITPHPAPSGVTPNYRELCSLTCVVRVVCVGSLVKQGWLTKKGGQRRNWKTRWCVLKTNEFSYYTNKKVRRLFFHMKKEQKTLIFILYYAAQDAKPKGTIVLSGITVKPSSHKEFCFGISTTERTYLMAGKVPCALLSLVLAAKPHQVLLLALFCSVCIGRHGTRGVGGRHHRLLEESGSVSFPLPPQTSPLTINLLSIQLKMYFKHLFPEFLFFYLVCSIFNLFIFS
jgi:hypothetical protein